MKKNYSKPVLLVESFQLNAAFADSCSAQGLKTINHWLSTCRVGDYFGSEICEVNLSDEEEYNTVCYHAPYPISDFTYS